MNGRVVAVADAAADVRLHHRQICICHPGTPPSCCPYQRRIPASEVAVLILEHRDVTVSLSAMGAIVDAGGVVLVCDQRHMPTAMMVPLGSHSIAAALLRTQLDVNRPTQKRLWQQIIRAKITSQARTLPAEHPTAKHLLAMVQNVRSGDADNREAVAARRYWQALYPSGVLPGPFRRQPRGGAAPNPMLDYGYALLRAALARAIVSAGLAPAIGLKHHNRSNTFALADDLIEPLRPLIDGIVRRAVIDGRYELVPDTKRDLLEVLHMPLVIDKQTGPMLAVLPRYIASLVRCMKGEATDLTVPVPADPAAATHRSEEPEERSSRRHGAEASPLPPRLSRYADRRSAIQVDRRR
jgi:CRISPR-associated protein Cas1